MAGEANEKCAVSAFVANEDTLHAAGLIHETLFSMQHRGAEATGIASQMQNGSVETLRERGTVSSVYNNVNLARLAGSTAIGHNRYSTSGSKLKHPQPFKDTPTGFAYAHNGNLPVTKQLTRYLDLSNINVDQFNDSEMMGLAISQFIRSGRDLPEAVELAYPLFRGAFSSVAMHDGMVVAFRDSKGIRPLAIGESQDGFAIASETCGLDIIDAEYLREVKPGEIAIITKGKIESKQVVESDPKLDMFEFVYFARPDSLLYDQRVADVRRRFGEQLAVQHPPGDESSEDLLVIPVPETSIPAAEAYAEKLGLSRRTDAIIKNRYARRAFMQPAAHERREHVRRKHNIIPEVVRGKHLLFIDDSIVRLDTIPVLAEQAHAAGAKSLSFLIASAPVPFPDYYGIDTPKQSELAAANLTIEEMREKIDCKYLGFLSLDRMIQATTLPAEQFN